MCTATYFYLKSSYEDNSFKMEEFKSMIDLQYPITFTLQTANPKQ